jgi:hypothetical protein
MIILLLIGISLVVPFLPLLIMVFLILIRFVIFYISRENPIKTKGEKARHSIDITTHDFLDQIYNHQKKEKIK